MAALHALSNHSLAVVAHLAYVSHEHLQAGVVGPAGQTATNQQQVHGVVDDVVVVQRLQGNVSAAAVHAPAAAAISNRSTGS
jgi:hypothetical protein